MARQVLPVNFQDDVLNASMNGKRRYMLLQQDDGSYILNDVTSYDTEGSTFGAAQINATNQAVNQSVDKDDVLNTSEEVEANVDEKKVTGALVARQLISDLGGLTFGQDEEGNWGYKPSGADAVIPFSPPVVTLKGSMAYNLSISAGNQDSVSTRIFAPEDMEIESIQYTTSGRFYGSNYMRIYDGSNNMIANRTSAGGTTITEITDRSSVAIGLYRGGQNIGGAEGNFGCSYTITFKKTS